MRALRTITPALLALAGAALAARAQVTVASPAEQRLRVTTASEEAANHFWKGLADGRNIFWSRAAMHLDKAIELDPNLGLASVMRGWFAPGLTQDERKAAVDAGIAKMTSATTGELVTALGIREQVAGNTERARVLFGAAAKLHPGDPGIAFYRAWTQPESAQAAAFREVTTRFPDDAPSYNILAYTLWQQGDKPGAMAAVQRYVQLAPDHPNSHDSYAELLQWEGRFSEALEHYGRAAQLDESFIEAYAGMAEVFQLTGRGGEARTQIQRAIARAPAKAAAMRDRRALGHSFLLDGMLKEGTTELTTAAREAQELNRKSVAAQVHRDLAVAEALLGRGSGVTQSITSHLAAAAQLDEADAPIQLAVTAFAHARAGDVAIARRAAQQLAARDQSDTKVAAMTRMANAAILLREKKAPDAIKELTAIPQQDNFIRALLADAQRAAGNKTEAQTLLDRVVKDPQLDLSNSYDVMARVCAARVKI